jgi:hypothetical protein
MAFQRGCFIDDGLRFVISIVSDLNIDAMTFTILVELESREEAGVSR